MAERNGVEKFRVRVGEREHEVEVTLDASGQRRVSVDGQPFEVADAGGHALRVAATADGAARQLEVTLAGAPRPCEAWVSGARAKLSVLTVHEARLAEAIGKSAVGSGGGSLTAPMPGRVVKVLVCEGQAIEHGAPAIIVEAMKMENELQAPSSGVVTRVSVGEGDTVEAGQVLCEIAAPEPDPADP
jgi:glutaconyl-CoA/methylmalonyl-CoA decarboxylase subunit gamma